MHLDKDSNVLKYYNFGSRIDHFVLNTPERVVAVSFSQKEFLVINLTDTTNEVQKIPIALNNNKGRAFYFPDSDLICVEDEP